VLRPERLQGAPVVIEPEEICPSSEEWLPTTRGCRCSNHSRIRGECPFYRGGWQNFLLATQPDANGTPAIRMYPTIDDLFQPAKPHGANRHGWATSSKPADDRSSSIRTATRSTTEFTSTRIREFRQGEPPRDGQGNPGRRSALFFPAGVVEFKSAWQEVDPSDPSLVRTTSA